MDQLTSFRARQSAQTVGRTAVKRVFRFALVVGALVAALGVGFRFGRSDRALPDWVPPRVASILGASPMAKVSEGPVI